MCFYRIRNIFYIGLSQSILLRILFYKVVNDVPPIIYKYNKAGMVKSIWKIVGQQS